MEDGVKRNSLVTVLMALGLDIDSLSHACTREQSAVSRTH